MSTGPTVTVVITKTWATTEEAEIPAMWSAEQRERWLTTNAEAYANNTDNVEWDSTTAEINGYIVEGWG